MPNPGSPQAMRDMQQQQPMQPMPKGTMLAMLFMLLLMMVVMQFKSQIGGALNVVFQFIDFNGDKPVLTLIIGGVIMATLATVIRAFLTDSVEMARTQHVQRQFREEMRDARTENNLYKMKKLQERQMSMQAASLETSAKQMKSMPVISAIIIPIFAWVGYFIDNTVPKDLLAVAMPWGEATLTDNVCVIPIWIVIYTLISLPIGQLENKIMQYLLLGRRLKILDTGEKSAARNEKA